MAGKEPIRVVGFARAWNFSLSLFSICGVVACVPLLLYGPTAGLLSMGFEQSVCAHPETYGAGYSGMYVEVLAAAAAAAAARVCCVCGRRGRGGLG